MNREQEFARQLERDNNRVSRDLLNNPEWEWLRNFYEAHFDEIFRLLRSGNPRLVMEDFYHFEPSLQPMLSEHHMFLYQVNCAIKDGALRKSMFEYSCFPTCSCNKIFMIGVLFNFINRPDFVCRFTNNFPCFFIGLDFFITYFCIGFSVKTEFSIIIISSL